VLIKFTPLWEVVRKVLTGSGECAVVNWRFLGLAMPAWVLIWAFALGTAGVIANLRSWSEDPTVERRFADS
jgi:disulfide bond formation protein DsbB